MTATGPDTLRSIDLSYVDEHRFRATTATGATIDIGEGGDLFSPVELLLAALAACSALDVEYITTKRAPFESFLARSQGDKIRDTEGNHMINLDVTFDVTFPEGEEGDAARAVLDDAIEKSQTRLCTVGRTVTLGSPVKYHSGSLD